MEEKKENSRLAVWVAFIGLISSALAACIYNADKLQDCFSADQEENSTFIDCIEYSTRHDYLLNQLELESGAEKIIFVTDKLTNAYFTEDFFKKDIEPSVLSKKSWQHEFPEILDAMRRRGANLQSRIQYYKATVICLVSEEYIDEQIKEGEINVNRLKRFIDDARKYTNLKLVVVPREQVARLVKGAAIITSNGITRVVVASQANSVIPDLNFDKDAICSASNPAIAEFIKQSYQLIETYQARDINFLEEKIKPRIDIKLKNKHENKKNIKKKAGNTRRHETVSNSRPRVR